MKIQYSVDETGKYYLSNNIKFNITEYIPVILNIDKNKFENFIRENGAFKHINGKFYFHKKENIINVINTLKKN